MPLTAAKRTANENLFASLASSIRTAGGAIGIAIYSSIITSKVGHDLVPTLATAAVKAGLPAASVQSFICKLARLRSASWGPWGPMLEN